MQQRLQQPFAPRLANFSVATARVSTKETSCAFFTTRTTPISSISVAAAAITKLQRQSPLLLSIASSKPLQPQTHRQ
jgi:hypothetical protein